MVVVEVGINIGMKNLINIRYYSSSDRILNPNIRAKFLAGLKDYITDIFDDEINVISLQNFEIICHYKMVQIPSVPESKSRPLLSFAIIERNTNRQLVQNHLEKMITQFLKKYSLDDIFSKNPKYFKAFIPQIDENLGDLRLKIGDRIKSIFR